MELMEAVTPQMAHRPTRQVEVTQQIAQTPQTLLINCLAETQIILIIQAPTIQPMVLLLAMIPTLTKQQILGTLPPM